MLMAFFSIPLLSQETKIVGLEYIIHDSTFNVSTYDYITHEKEQLFTIPRRIQAVNVSFTYDPYSQNYYYVKGKGSCGEPSYYVLSSINITEQTINELYRLPSDFSFLNLEYEPYSNSILIRGINSVSYLDLDTGQLSEHCAIVTGSGIPTSRTDFFNTLENKYFYTTSFGWRSSRAGVYVDLNECTYDSLGINFLDTFSFMHKYDFITNTVYGIAYNKSVYPFNCNFIKFDPNTGAIDSISCVQNFNAEGGNVGAAIDSYNGKYLLYYTNRTGSSELAIIDVLTGEMEVVPYDFHAGHLYIKQSALPLLKFENEVLMGSVCQNYKWYCDNEIIENANDQTFTPTKNGLYKFSTSYNGLDTVFSNEIYVTIFSGIDSQQSSDKIAVHPNPTTGIINLACEAGVRIQYACLVDMYGNVLQSHDKISGNFIQFDFSSLCKGSYYLKIAFNNTSVTKKIIKI